MLSYLPPNNGLLPFWLLFVSVLSVGNSIQAHLTLHYTRQVYAGPPSSNQSSAPGSPHVTPLQSRTFGTWTLLSSIIRLYAAYNISNPLVYQLAIWTYVIAWCHFMSEWLLLGTARWGRGIAGPAIVANVSVVWMLTQWKYYVP